MKVGIFPGTFDPVHAGHTGFARAAAVRCGLDKVVLLPEASPRDKTEVSSLARRLSQLEVAASASELEVVSLTDARFSVQDTLPALESKWPGAALTLLVGSDVVRTFAYRWPGLEILLARMSLAIGVRAGDDWDAVEARLLACQAALDIDIDYQLINSPYPHAASSRLRTAALEQKEVMSETNIAG